MAAVGSAGVAPRATPPSGWNGYVRGRYSAPNCTTAWALHDNRDRQSQVRRSASSGFPVAHSLPAFRWLQYTKGARGLCGHHGLGSMLRVGEGLARDWQFRRARVVLARCSGMLAGVTL